jgi:hypothetical protein
MVKVKRRKYMGFRQLRSLVLGSVAAAAIALAPSLSYAVPIIDFSGQAGGTVTVSGGNAVGTNVSISHVQGIDTPSNSGPQFVVTNGVLNFDTVAGTLSIMGGVADAGIANGSLLLSGTISSFSITPNLAGISFTATGPDTKSREILRFFGLPLNTAFAYFGFSTDAITATPGTFNAVSTDITNVAVPEPGSVLLLGSGLAGIGVWSMKRRESA